MHWKAFQRNREMIQHSRIIEEGDFPAVIREAYSIDDVKEQLINNTFGVFNLSSIPAGQLLSPIERSVFNLQQQYWITPDNLGIEMLISEAERPKEEAHQSFWPNWFTRRIPWFQNKEEKPPINSIKPPIFFVHGSFHSAWYFAENFMPYFTARGHDCYAISLRGTAATGMPPTDPGESVRIEDHIADVSYCLDEILRRYRETGRPSTPPVLVAHSFGGMVAMKLLELQSVRNKLSGVALLCSVPPSGNGDMAMRFLQRRPCASLQILLGFVLKTAARSLWSCRKLFFDSTVSSSDINLYMRRFQADSRVGLNLLALKEVLPSKVSADQDGRASWLKNDDGLIPARFVLHAARDYLVDEQGAMETASYLGCGAAILADAYHDVMLGPRWPAAAAMVAAWIDTVTAMI